MDGKTGAKQWEFETGKPVYSSPLIGVDGTVYLGSTDGNVYALNGKTGAVKWEVKTGDPMTSSPVIGKDGLLYIGTGGNKVCAIKTDSKGLAETPWPMRGKNPQHTGRLCAS